MRDGGYMVRMHLPSGRCLHYLNATLEKETVTGKDGKPWTRTVIYYDGIEHSATQNEDGSTARKSHKWGRTKTYGGKLTENGDQGFSRDALLNGMLLSDEMGFELFGLFHDELAAEVPDDPWGLGIADLRQCMMEPPSWAPGIPLGAEGFESKFYRK
jgi:DNA polymerase